MGLWHLERLGQLVPVDVAILLPDCIEQLVGYPGNRSPCLAAVNGARAATAAPELFH